MQNISIFVDDFMIMIIMSAGIKRNNKSLNFYMQHSIYNETKNLVLVIQATL